MKFLSKLSDINVKYEINSIKFIYNSKKEKIKCVFEFFIIYL